MKYLSYENIFNNMEVNIDLNQNKWVTSIPKNNLDNVINKYLRLGYIVSTLSQQTINPMNGIFDPIINFTIRIFGKIVNFIEIPKNNKNLMASKSSVV